MVKKLNLAVTTLIVLMVLVNLPIQFISTNNDGPINLNELSNDPIEIVSTRADIDPYSDLILTSNTIKIIAGDFDLFGNLTLLSDAKLKIQNANFNLNGWLKLAETSQLIIKDSTVTINPPVVTEYQSIVNLTGDCVVSISNSDITFNGQSIETLVPYILSTDNSNVTISDTILTTNYPPVPLEVRWSTAGLMLLTATASWTLTDTRVNANMHDEGAYRWCILQAGAHFTAIDVENNINDPSKNAFLKPNAGHLYTENCRFVGRMPVAVLGEAEFVNTTIRSQIEILDNAIVSVSSSMIENIISGYWSGGLNTSELPAPQLILNNSEVKNLAVSGNTTVSVIDSKVRNLNADANAVVKFVRSAITVPNIPISVAGNVSLYIDSPVAIWRITSTSGTCRITLVNTSLIRLTIYQDSLDLNLLNTTIEELRTYGNMEIHGRLIDSKINEFINTELEGENGLLNFTLIESSIPPPLVQPKLTTNIYYPLEVQSTLNDLPAPVDTLVKIHNRTGLIASRNVNLTGVVTVNLLHKIVAGSRSFVQENFTVEASYLGFSSSRTINLNRSIQVNFAWTDQGSPEISNIEYSPTNWNSEKWITVSATVNDNDINAISNVTLLYSTDGGRSWVEKDMFEVRNNEYESIIPRQSRTTEVEFYIEAYDMAGNKQESPVESFEVGQEYTIIINILLVVFIWLIIIFGLIALLRKQKIDKYSIKGVSKSKKSAVKPKRVVK
jgi:hypothetical protein